MKGLIGEIAARGIRVVSNAGGMNPHGCAEAIAALAAEHGLALRIAVVEGDDVISAFPIARSWCARTAATPSLHRKNVSQRQCLSWRPAIRQALDQGAQIVDHGALVEQRRDPRRADARVRLACGRL